MHLKCMQTFKMSDSESDFDLEFVAEKALQNLLPKVSKEKYEKAYKDFKQWCDGKKIGVINESVLLAYFSTELSSTSWTTYSMLRSTLNVKDNIDIKGVQ